MKKVLSITLFLLMFSLATYAQDGIICQPDTILIYTNHSIIDGDTILIFNAYDNNGLFVQCEEHYIDNDMKGGYRQNIPPIQMKTNYEYDQSHNVAKMIKKGFSGPRPGSYISDYGYEGGKLISYVRKYSDDFMEYVRDSILYFYNASDRIQDETTYGLKGDLLVVCKRTNYKYTANETIITAEGYENGTWGDWLQLSQETRIFDEDSVLLYKESYLYGQSAKKETYSYDEEGHITSILTETWDSLGWGNNKLLEYSYNAEGHLILAEIKTWQEGVFVNANRASYELNETGYPTVVTFEKWDGEEWIQGTWQSGFHIFPQDYLKRQNDFICRRDAKKIVIHYVTTPMPDYDVDEHLSEEAFATIHPNPSTGLVTITGKAIKQAEVLNTLGQRMATAQGEGEQMTVDISTLPAGVYFVNVTDKDGRKCVRKVVKE